MATETVPAQSPAPEQKPDDNNSLGLTVHTIDSLLSCADARIESMQEYGGFEGNDFEHLVQLSCVLQHCTELCTALAERIDIAWHAAGKRAPVGAEVDDETMMKLAREGIPRFAELEAFIIPPPVAPKKRRDAKTTREGVAA